MNDYPRRHLDDRQMRQRWLDPRLSSLRVADIAAYLRSHGWRLADSLPGTSVYQEPASDGDGLFQWVPEDESGRDYVQRVYELLAGIADAEGRAAGEVLGDMLRRVPVESNGILRAHSAS